MFNSMWHACLHIYTHIVLDVCRLLMGIFPLLLHMGELLCTFGIFLTYNVVSVSNEC